MATSMKSKEAQQSTRNAESYPWHFKEKLCRIISRMAALTSFLTASK
ncbi:hypothetical protein LC55x_1134 [Lysobacter capsici]|nr:hypothetical protein LC55x_1134 [Lysobacter capsici]